MGSVVIFIFSIMPTYRRYWSGPSNKNFYTGIFLIKCQNTLKSLLQPNAIKPTENQEYYNNPNRKMERCAAVGIVSQNQYKTIRGIRSVKVNLPLTILFK